MKRLLALALGAMMLLSLADCASRQAEPESDPGVSLNGGQGAYMANPFVDYSSLADAARAAGFELTAPETVEGYTANQMIQVMNGIMIQVIYFDESENRVLVRKEAGSEDISGDYGVYSQNRTVAVNGCDVTLRGENDAVSSAIWTNGGYSFAVMMDVPMPAEAVTALIEQIS